MVSKRTTPSSLAESSGLDIDEVLVRLWDAGIDANGPTDAIAATQVRSARRALGVVDPRHMRLPAYWIEHLRLDEETFTTLLAELGIDMSREARTLPKGAIRRLRAKEREMYGGALAPATTRSDSLESLPVNTKVESLIWEAIGHTSREIRHLTVDEVRDIHSLLVRDFGESPDPIWPPGVKSETMLGSAVHRPHTANGGEVKYPTIEMAAAALLYAIINDHPFHNGNKRTALVSMGAFLYENGVQLTASQDALFKFVLKVSQRSIVARDAPDRSDREVLAISRWIRDNTRLIERGERVLTWLKFKRVLTHYGVTWSHPRKGNRIDLSRTCEEEERVGFRKRKVKRILNCQVAYRDDGREVARNTIDHVRHELHLDESHGIDSAAFYDLREEPDDFIVEYQQTLRRLAKL